MKGLQRTGIVVVSGAAALALWLGLRSSAREAPQALASAEAPAETEPSEAVAAKLALPPRASLPDESPGVEDESPVVPEPRRTAAAPPEEEDAPQPAPRADYAVYGQVIEYDGTPVPDVVVELRKPGGRKGEYVQRTDGQGNFDFGIVTLFGETRLIYGQGLFQRNLPNQLVTMDGLLQLLRMPKGPETLLELSLVGAEDEALPQPEWIHMALQDSSPLDPPQRQHPAAGAVEFFPGRILVHGLDTGQWKTWVRCAGGLPFPVDVTVERAGLHRQRVDVPSAPEGMGGDFEELRLPADAEAVRDPYSGFAELSWKGQGVRGFRKPGGNAHFGHTLQGFGAGPVKAAYLELDLEGEWGNCDNDGLNLEFLGRGAKPAWAWSSRISLLPGVGSWSDGKRMRILLDLASLPTKDDPRSLLGHLEDGQLDVFVSDDTIVHDLAIHVSR